MRKGLWSRLGLAGALGLAFAGSGVTVGCASEQEPISQVQPNYLRKSDLVGADKQNPTEWYMRMTVTEVSRSNHFAFPGLQDELRRIRWDIQERFLIARRSYELVSGSDGKGADPTKNDGVVVAMYPIESHFDVRRAYDPLTGSEFNIVTENPIDRPWYDREFMRVDWSRNLAGDPDFQGFWISEIFGDIVWEPVQYAEYDPKSPNAPVMQSSEGYMDVTSKYFAKTGDFWGIRGLPACWITNLFTGSDVLDCNTQEVAVRTSFMKVEDRDYEPAETDSEKWSLFGTFNRDRYGFNRQYEILDKGWHRLMARHNLWQKSHDDRACLTTNAGDRAKANEFCGSVGGSTCDPYADKCTIPAEKRQIRTMAYHVNRSMPADLWDTNKVLVEGWNQALLDAIAARREVECRRFGGGDAASCREKYFEGDRAKAMEAPAMVLCHNPVETDDHPSCGKAGTVAREGDLRFNLLAWVDMPLAQAPLGYGPNGADPLTGEVIQSTSYMYGAALDTYAAMARDLVAVANGDLRPDQFVDGAQVQQNLGGYQPGQAGKDAALFATVGDHLAGKLPKPTLTAADIASRVAGLQTNDFVAKLGAFGGLAGKASAAERLAAVQAMIAAKGVAGEAGFGGRAEAEARLKSIGDRLAGSKTEASLVETSDYLMSAALAPVQDDKQAKEMQHLTTPFGGFGPLQMAEIQGRLFEELERRGVCMYGLGEFNAPHLEGLAKRFVGKYADLTATERARKVFEDLRKAIYKGVTEHEIGHTMALRHNFQGSWDSMNFHPNYWKLRSADGKAFAACSAPRASNAPDNCLGPRYSDPETTEELGTGPNPHASIEEFSYSSIMDYGFDFNSDFHGLGSYDRAAMKFIYGGVVEVLPASSKVAAKIAPIHASPLNEQWLVKRPDLASGQETVQPTHYTTLARILQEENLIFDAARCREAKEGELDTAINGQICEAAPKEHAAVEELTSGKLTGIDETISAPLWKTADGRIRWPYRFGTDEYARYPHTLRFDAGADVYEAAENLAKLYEYRYVLDFFRRGRRGWLGFFMTGRLWDRYFSRMQSIGWLSSSKLGQYAAMYPDKKPLENPAVSSDDWGKGYALALTSLFATLERSILRPQPGGYEKKSAVAGQTKDLFEVPDNADGDGQFKIGVLGGRWIDDDLNNAKGGSFHYQSFMERAGNHMEKPLAVAALAAQFPPVHVFSRDTYVDGRNMLLNFRTLMPQAYDRLMAGVLANDTDALAPWVDLNGAKDSGGNLSVSYPELWEADPYKKAPAGTRASVDSLVGFRLQVPAMIYTFWLGQDDGTRSLQNSMRVWVEGGPEGLALRYDADPKKSEVGIFFEPDSGQLWQARNFGTETLNGLERPTGIGHRMLQHANFLLGGAFTVEVDAKGQPVYDVVTKRPKPAAGSTGVTVKDAAAYQTYRRYIGVLNVMRQYIWDLRGDLHGF
jgi:hypothetical protein